MHLTGGQFKGIKINTPNNVKPTLSKVRESIFNILVQYDLEDNSFLDMFAGSAIMGLEAVSRGYKVKELEINPKNVVIIKENFKKIRKNPDITVVNSLNYKSNDKYSIIYIDPPWNYDYSVILEKAKELLNDTGIIVIEHDNMHNFDVNILASKLNMNVIKSKKYGRCLIDIIRHL